MNKPYKSKPGFARPFCGKYSKPIILKDLITLKMLEIMSNDGEIIAQFLITVNG
jgi:hypothetical protein